MVNVVDGAPQDPPLTPVGGPGVGLGRGGCGYDWSYPRKYTIRGN